MAKEKPKPPKERVDEGADQGNTKKKVLKNIDSFDEFIDNKKKKKNNK